MRRRELLKGLVITSTGLLSRPGKILASLDARAGTPELQPPDLG